MSSFRVEYEDNFSIKNFTLKKFFTGIVESYRSGSTDGYSTILGSSYHGNYGDMYLDERFLNEPTMENIMSEQIDVLYDEIIGGNNIVTIDDLNVSAGKLMIETGKGNDVIDLDGSELSSKSKRLFVDAGDGEDIIVCSISHDERLLKKAPKVIFKGGKGSDIFYGVPERLEGIVQDFDINEDYLGFVGNSRKYRLHETSKGVAVIDKKRPNGMLLIEGVESVDQINILNENW